MKNIHRPLIAATLLALILAGCSQNPVAPETTAAAPVTPVAPVAPAKPADPAPAPQGGGADVTGRGTTGLAQDGKGSEPGPAPRPLESIGAPEQRSVYFDFDRFDIRDEFKTMLTDHAKFVASRADARMLIQGHADERGSREYNLALGQRRADAVKKSLMVQGIKEESLESVSLGEEKPKAVGRDEASWAENRRADMLYKGEY